MSWKDATEGCHRRMTWKDVTEGCHRRMSWKDAMEGCHGRWKFIQGKKKREGEYSVPDEINAWINICMT